MHSSRNKPEKVSGRFFNTLVILLALPVCCMSVFISPCAAATPAKIIRVGSELEFPPYAFLDKQGQPAGFSVDLIRAVADAMGFSVTIATGPWDMVWNDLAEGGVDVLPIVAKLSERTRLVDFSLPHTETFDAFFVRAGNAPIRTIKEARGKQIVVMRSDAAQHALEERRFAGNLVLVNTIPEGLSLVASGRHDAFLCSKLIGILTIKKHRIQGLKAGPPVPEYKRVFSFAVKKGNAELLEKLNQGLLIVKTNGQYDRIYEKWLSVDDPWRRYRRYRRYFAPALVVVLVAITVSGAGMLLLQRLVRKRTAELAQTNKMLVQARMALEEKVAARTEALSRANLSLQDEIADRKKAEEGLKLVNDELAASNKDLEAFIYSVSHDLRGHLMSTSSFSELIKVKYGDQLDGRGKEYLSRVIRGTKRMNQVIEDLLSLSSISRHELKREDIDLSRIAYSIIAELRERMPERAVNINIVQGMRSHADPRVIRVALSNLLDNAWKFTSKKPDGKIEFGMEVMNGTKAYYVKDNGAGFDGGNLLKILSPFVRLHSEKEFEGTGIGLAIVERVILRHGGKIWAESSINAGASFFFTLEPDRVADSH